MIIAIRLLHVVGGIFWIGVILFNAVFLGPAVREAGPEGGKVMGILVRRGLTTIMPIVGLLTILAGIYLLYKASGGFKPEYMGSAPGVTYSIGGTCAIIALAVGGAVLAPALSRLTGMAQAMAQATPADREKMAGEMQALRIRAGMAGNIIAMFAFVTAVCMAIGRYV